MKSRLLSSILAVALLFTAARPVDAAASSASPMGRSSVPAPSPRIAPTSTVANGRAADSTSFARAALGRVVSAAPKGPREAKSSVALEKGPPRDWGRAPAIVEHTPKGAVLAVSDVHGRYADTFRLLEANKVLRGSIDNPSKVVWTGKNSTLVVVGDVINKGGGSLKLVDMFRSLQESAEKHGGKVIVTMGNHEANFLHQPNSEKSMRDGSQGKFGFGHEIERAGGSAKATALGRDPEGRGQWLRALPFAARVGDNFFIHSGNTRAMDVKTLSTTIERAVASGGFGHSELVGRDHTSVLGAADWRVTASDAKMNAEKLGVKRIVMGHVPAALDAHGHIASGGNGALVKLDTGFGDGHAPPRLLQISRSGAMHQVDTEGAHTKLEE